MVMKIGSCASMKNQTLVGDLCDFVKQLCLVQRWFYRTIVLKFVLCFQLNLVGT